MFIYFVICWAVHCVMMAGGSCRLLGLFFSEGIRTPRLLTMLFVSFFCFSSNILQKMQANVYRLVFECAWVEGIVKESFSFSRSLLFLHDSILPCFARTCGLVLPSCCLEHLCKYTGRDQMGSFFFEKQMCR